MNEKKLAIFLVVAVLAITALACSSTRTPEPVVIPRIVIPTVNIPDFPTMVPIPTLAPIVIPTFPPIPTMPPISLPTAVILPTVEEAPIQQEPYSCVCDSRATEIELNENLSKNMPQGGAYPSNCQRWCVCVPPDGSQLDISISGSVDFDLYVAYDDFEGITGEQLIQGENYYWMSNSYSGKEYVGISSPDGGDYYIEVCSYNGDPGPYDMTTAWR